MFKWIIRIINFFDRHPWDWIAHIILGFLVFILNFSLLRAIDYLIYPLFIQTIIIMAGLAAVNFVVAIELTQLDIFGLSWKITLDSIIDFIANLIGIGLAIFLRIIFIK